MCRFFVRKNRKEETMIEIVISPVIAALFFTLIKKEKHASYVTRGLIILQIMFFPIGAFVFWVVCETILDAGGKKKPPEDREWSETDGNMALALHTGLFAYCVAFLYSFCEALGITAIFCLVSVLANGFLVARWKAPSRRCALCVLFLAALTVRRIF